MRDNDECTCPHDHGVSEDACENCYWCKQDEPRFRICGCPMDYHLSDCPIVTPVTELDYELPREWPYSEAWRQDD